MSGARMSEGADELLDQLSRSMTAVGRLISDIRPDQWSAPTPCDEWEVRRVAEHLIGMNRVFASMLANEAPPQRGQADPDEVLPQAFRDSSAALPAAFAQPSGSQATPIEQLVAFLGRRIN